MGKEKFDELPKTLRIRELKRGGKILITTMLYKNRVSATQIKNLYKQRWQIEVDFRNIKSTLGLKHFSCKTPKIEPRAIKRRHNDFPLLMKTRDIKREEIRKNGHPKKLK